MVIGERSILATLFALLVLMGTPAGVAAKPGFSVEGPQSWSEFQLPATHGYRIRVSAATAAGKRSSNVSISASEGHRSGVEYLVRGLSTPSGLIRAKLPGVGRVAVRFNELRVDRGAVADNCKGRPSLIRHGVFEGRIELHGEHGYTAVHRNHALGKITQSFRQVCDQREGGNRGASGGGGAHLETLFAGQEGRRSIDFSVSRFDFGPKFGEPHVFFSASSSIRHHGFFVTSSASAEGESATFSTPDSAGALGEALVAPPAPFHGSATFHLDSPTSAGWTGTLGVELTGVGDVALTGAGFLSALCEDTTCTKTLPPNVRVQFLG